jgi:hypothetical protein
VLFSLPVRFRSLGHKTVTWTLGIYDILHRKYNEEQREIQLKVMIMPLYLNLENEISKLTTREQAINAFVNNNIALRIKYITLESALKLFIDFFIKQYFILSVTIR